MRETRAWAGIGLGVRARRRGGYVCAAGVFFMRDYNGLGRWLRTHCWGLKGVFG